MHGGKSVYIILMLVSNVFDLLISDFKSREYREMKNSKVK